MGGINLNGVGKFLQNAAGPVAGALAEHAAHQEADRRQRLQEGYAALASQRADRQLNLQEAAQNVRSRVPTRVVKQADGTYVTVPTRQNADGSAIGGAGGDSDSPVGDAMQRDFSEQRQSTPSFTPKPWALPRGAGSQDAPPPSTPPYAQGDTAASRQPISFAGIAGGADAAGQLGMPKPATPAPPAPAKPPYAQGVHSTGVVGSVPRTPLQIPKQTTAVINGRPVRGGVNASGTFAADTTAQGDTVYAPTARGRAPADGNDAGLNHNINNVRSQIAEADRQLAQLAPAIKAGSDRFASPAQQQAATSAQQQMTALKTRRDSLQSVHDGLIGRQQSAGGYAPPAPRPAPSGGSPYRMTPDRTKAMQDEFDSASNDLKSILDNPAAPAAIKKQAREVYQQHQSDIARKYGALPPGSDE